MVIADKLKKKNNLKFASFWIFNFFPIMQNFNGDLAKIYQ